MQIFIWISDVFCQQVLPAPGRGAGQYCPRCMAGEPVSIICGLQIIFPSFMSKVFKIWHIHQILCAHTHWLYPQHFHRTALIQAIWLPLEILYFLQINIYSWRERNAHFEQFSRRPEYLPADLTTTTREQSAYMNINLRRVNEHYAYNA